MGDGYPRWDDEIDAEGWPVLEFPVDLDLDLNAEDLAHGFHIETIPTPEDDSE